MLQGFRSRMHGGASRGPVRRPIGVLMLLSAVGASGAAVLWFTVGLVYAALGYAATIGLLYVVVVRMLARKAPQPADCSSDLTPTAGTPLRPDSGAPPLRR